VKQLFSTCNIRTQLNVNSKPVTEYLYPGAYHAVFFPDIFLGGGGIFSTETYNLPQNGSQIVPNYSLLSNQKDANLSLKRTKTRLAVGAKMC